MVFHWNRAWGIPDEFFCLGESAIVSVVCVCVCVCGVVCCVVSGVVCGGVCVCGVCVCVKRTHRYAALACG